jgi:uncharacterized membrane protein YdjX (TVP38/TMEM64 family)
MNVNKKREKRLILDAIALVTSIACAIALVQTPFIDALLLKTEGHFILSTFIAGLFFTSAFTTAPAVVILGKLSLIYDPLLVAMIGGIGALLGDLLIFTFVKSYIAQDITFLLSHAKSRRIRYIFKYRFTRWSLALVGALIIASPLPDELGLALMGISNISTRKFTLISLTFNTIGILLIGFVASSI